MEPAAMGKFLASLRREQGLTQEALGELLGVSNKTVSRWENANYLPDLAMLERLAALYGVSIDELIAGKRRDGEAPAPEAAPPAPSPFSDAERRHYFKAKWRRDHRALLILLALLCLAVIAAPLALRRPRYVCLAPLLVIAVYAFQNNRMMAYVEASLYDG